MILFDLKILTLLLALFVYSYRTSVEVQDRTVSLETIVHNVTLDNVYDFVTNPDGFERWFRWIPRAYRADHRPVGVGKKYIVHFVTSPIVFTTNNLVICDDEITFSLKSEALIKPQFEIVLYDTGKFMKYPRVKIKISLILNRDSYLFNLTVGNIVQNVARSRMKEALTHLNNIFIKLYRSGYTML